MLTWFLVLAALARFPDRTAFANDEATTSYRQLGEFISRSAQHLDALGLAPGDVVAQLSVNRFEDFAISAAVYLRGLRSVTLRAQASEADHAFILKDCGARFVAVDEYHRARAGPLKLLLNRRHPMRIADAGGDKVWDRLAA